MKTFPGVVKILALVTALVVVVVSLRAVGPPDSDQPPIGPEPNYKFVLKIKNRHPVKDVNAFKTFLIGFTATYRFHLKDPQGHEEMFFPPPAGKPTASPYTKLDIKTDKITVSDLAKRDSHDITLIGVHVTQQVASDNVADIAAVLNQLQP